MLQLCSWTYVQPRADWMQLALQLLLKAMKERCELKIQPEKTRRNSTPTPRMTPRQWQRWRMRRGRHRVWRWRKWKHVPTETNNREGARQPCGFASFLDRLVTTSVPKYMYYKSPTTNETFHKVCLGQNFQCFRLLDVGAFSKIQRPSICTV